MVAFVVVVKHVRDWIFFYCCCYNNSSDIIGVVFAAVACMDVVRLVGHVADTFRRQRGMASLRMKLLLASFFPGRRQGSMLTRSARQLQPLSKPVSAFVGVRAGNEVFWALEGSQEFWTTIWQCFCFSAERRVDTRLLFNHVLDVRQSRCQPLCRLVWFGFGLLGLWARGRMCCSSLRLRTEVF